MQVEGSCVRAITQKLAIKYRQITKVKGGVRKDVFLTEIRYSHLGLHVE